MPRKHVKRTSREAVGVPVEIAVDAEMTEEVAVIVIAAAADADNSVA